MGDPDEPRAQGTPVGFTQSAFEVAVRLEEGLLGEVFGIVVVADAVVAVRVDVAQVDPIELCEASVELRLGLWCDFFHSTGAYPGLGGSNSAPSWTRTWDCVTARSTVGFDPPSTSAASPSIAGAASRSLRAAAANSGIAVHGLGGLTERRLISAAGTPWARSSPARRLRDSRCDDGRDEVAGAGEAGERLGAAPGPRKRVDLGEHLARRRARDIRARHRGRRRRERRGILAQPASSTPVTSVVIGRRASRRGEHLRAGANPLVERGEHDRRAPFEHPGRMRRPAERADRASAASARRRKPRGASRAAAPDPSRDEQAGAARGLLAVRREHSGQRLATGPRGRRGRAAELELGGAHHRRCRGARPRAGSARWPGSPGQLDRLLVGSAAELDFEARARERDREARAPEPAPMTLRAGSAASPPSHSHWSITHGQIRAVTAPASGGEGSRPVGKRSGRPARIRTLRGRIRQPRRTASVPITATGTTGAPVSSAEPPNAAVRLAERPGRVRVPSGKIRTMSPRARIAFAVSIISASPRPG